ncbi:unnamed protein product [Heterobilharzia americana]|nr:unnamed protein product [Heterobilharzia americana]
MEQDPEVTLSDTLGAPVQCRLAANKAYGVFGFLSRTLGSLTPLFTTVYALYIRTYPEKNSLVMSPYLKKDTVIVERVQRRVTNKVIGLRHKLYPDSLVAPKLHPIQYRRIGGV